MGSKLWAFLSRQQMTSAFVFVFFSESFIFGGPCFSMKNRWRTGSPVAVGFF